MLIPRRVKHRKQHHPGRSGAAKGGTKVVFGEYGIQALEPAYVTNRQIESARIAMTRHIKRGGKVWINIYPDRPLTKKPAETRMGSGKGAPDHWVAVVKPGRILFEMAGVDHESAVEAMRLASHKLPVATRVVVRDNAPEATRAVIEREAPGLSEAMRSETLKKTEMAMISRGVCGIRSGTLIVNLPGSPAAVRECFAVIRPVLGHAVTLLAGRTHEEAKQA